VTPLSPLLQAFFTQHLASRRVSGHTVSSYRDCFKLLLGFARLRTGKSPQNLDLADIDAELVTSFLDYLEHDRHNSVETRNLRLVALHSFFSYAALHCPAEADVIRKVLAVPAKRRDHRLVSFLNREETEALVLAPDRATRHGERDHFLLLVAVQSGLRVSELTALRWGDVTFGAGAHVHTLGKGRKERDTPLTQPTARLLQAWLGQRGAEPSQPVFLTHRLEPLSTDAVEDLVDKHVKTATALCGSLANKRVTPHTLRHTCAMNLLRAGVDLATIAMYLGHSSTKATEVYLHADLALKEQALARTAPTEAAKRRYRPPDELLAFLESL
jgi:integrase